MLTPVCLAAGATVDISRAVSTRSDLQGAVDATALGLAHLPSSTSQATLQTDAQTWINAELNNKNIGTTTVHVTSTSSTIVLSASVNLPTTVIGLAGISQLPVTASSTVQWGLSHVEVALVLDNTGSMTADNKMPTLISSANTLVNTLFSQNTSGDPNAVKIAVVPFTQTVKVGSSYQTATWISPGLPTAYATALNAAYSGLSWPNGTDIFTTAGTNRFTLFSQMHTTWGGCVESRPAPYDAQDTAPTTSNAATLFVPYFAPDEPGAGNTSSSNNGGYTNDYMADGLTSGRGVTYTWLQLQGNQAKYTATPRSGTSSSGYAYGPNAGCTTVQPILRLTTSQTSILATINAMTAGGDTNLNIGFMWGWHAISPNAPFGDGVAYGTPNVKKIIVFLTDGWNEATAVNNNNNTYYSGIGYAWQNRIGVGNSASQTQRGAALDARTLLACQNAQAAGITVYTVRIDVASSQSPAVLQACASSASDFYDVPNVANLPVAFGAIAGSIGHLRISQ
jgi:Flp pilus assembly protein TadG